MKKTTKPILAAVLAITSLLAASCMKQEVPAQSQVNENGKVTLTIEGVLDGFEESEATKADVIQTVRVGWAGNDAVYVYQGSTYLGFVTTPQEIINDKVAILSGNIDAPRGASPVLTFVYSNMFDKEPDLEDNKIAVDMSIQGEKIPFVLYGNKEYDAASVSNLQVSFKFATSMLIVSATNLKASTAIDNAILSGVCTTCELTLNDDGSVDVGASNPGKIVRTAGFTTVGAAGTSFIKFGVPECDNTSKSLKVKQGNDIRVKNGFTSHEFNPATSYNIIINTEEHTPPKGALTGKFSISPYEQVYFSEGNLWHDGTNDTWSFEDKQYNYNYTYWWSADHLSYFHWSNKSSVAISWEYSDESAQTNDVLFTNDPANASLANPNFTVNDAQGVWRTLTTEEWNYLLNYRGSGRGEGNLYFRCPVTVHIDDYNYADNCLVIAPDGNDTEILSYYDDDTWPTAEENGFVCLPAAGSYASDYDYEMGANYWGQYWSSNGYEFDESFETYTGGEIYFQSESGIFSGVRDIRANGGCLRLVTE